MEKRGRKVGSNKSLIKIEDSLIEPYSIHSTEYSFEIFENDKFVGSFTTLGSALNRLATLVTIQQNTGSAMTLCQYVNELKTIKNQIEQLCQM